MVVVLDNEHHNSTNSSSVNTNVSVCLCCQDKEDQLSCVFSDDYSQGLPSDIEWGNEFEEDLGMYSYF